jgi:hypothetical protein
MMSTVLLQIPLSDVDGSYIVAEVDPVDLTGTQYVADDGGGRVTKAAGTLTEAFSTVQPAIEMIVSRLQSVSPDEIKVDFGLKIGGEAGIIWAKGTAEANISISVTWRPGETRRRGEPQNGDESAAKGTEDAAGVE